MTFTVQPPTKRSFAQRLDDRAVEHVKRFVFEATGKKIRTVEIDTELCYLVIWRKVIHHFNVKSLPLEECTYEQALTAIHELSCVVKNVKDLVSVHSEKTKDG